MNDTVLFIYIYIYIYIYTLWGKFAECLNCCCMYMCVCVCVYICMCVYMYVYIYKTVLFLRNVCLRVPYDLHKPQQLPTQITPAWLVDLFNEGAACLP